MKRAVMVALVALLAGCADSLTGPGGPQVGAKSASTSDVYCFIELEGCIPYEPPPPPPPTPLLPYPCHFELHMDENGQLFEVLVCQ